MFRKWGSCQAGTAQPSLTVDTLTELAMETVVTLDFSNRQQVVRRLVERVVADRDKVLIIGQIPINQGTYMELRHEDRPGGIA